VGLFNRKYVSKQATSTLDEIKQNIQECILNVATETVHKVASKVTKTVEAYIAERSGHFQHLF
jgi:hypothetical protein